MQTYRPSFAVVPVCSKGFARIDLLAVLTIFAISMLLIIPSIQSTREAARRDECRNSLRRLGLALQIRASWNGASQPDTMEMNPANINDDHIDTRLLLAATTAIFAAISAILGALFIMFAVQFFNRRDNRLVNGIINEQESISMLGSWFCPPSSSPN
jgi:type II secretory pathway pseudopilin PulG